LDTDFGEEFFDEIVVFFDKILLFFRKFEK